MSNVPPPARPPVPGRPPVPSAVVPPKPAVPQVSAPVAPPSPAPVAPPSPAPVAPPSPAPVAPPAPAPVAPPAPAPVATDNTVQTVVAPAGTVPTEAKKKRGKPTRNLTAWYGTYVYADVTSADGVTAPELQYDTIDGAQVPRRQKLQSVPALTKDGGVDGGFDPAKNEPLKPANFVKLGDYHRFMASIHQSRVDAALKLAADADAGKVKVAKRGKPAGGGVAAKLMNQIQEKLAALKGQMSPEAYAAVEASFTAVLQGAAKPATDQPTA